MLRPSDPLGVAGVLLAAGASRRMGPGRRVLGPGQVIGGRGAGAGRGRAPPVVSRCGGVSAPPLLFRRALFGELLAWSGEGCGKTVVQGHRDEALFLDWPAEVLADVDTPEDFAAATARLNPR